MTCTQTSIDDQLLSHSAGLKEVAYSFRQASLPVQGLLELKQT